VEKGQSTRGLFVGLAWSYTMQKWRFQDLEILYLNSGIFLKTAHPNHTHSHRWSFTKPHSEPFLSLPASMLGQTFQTHSKSHLLNAASPGNMLEIQLYLYLSIFRCTFLVLTFCLFTLSPISVPTLKFQLQDYNEWCLCWITFYFGSWRQALLHLKPVGR
jgi:hypothetical protein